MFAENIKKLRKESDLSQKEFADILHLPVTTYQTYEQGRSEPSIALMSQMADYFEVSIDYLVGRSDDVGIVSVSSNLTEFEDGALTLLRKLNKVQQHQVVGYMQALLTA